MTSHSSASSIATTSWGSSSTRRRAIVSGLLCSLGSRLAEVMLPPRVIPCLLLLDGLMVKTIRFSEPTYVGDPINVVNLFHQFEVDEICLLLIGATRAKRGP